MTPTGLITDIITDLPVELAKNQLATLWQTQKTKRFERFLSTIQTEMERISEEQRHKLNEYVATEEAQDRLIEFVDSVLLSSDKRVHIALALLYANDRDYSLSDKEKHSFCMAVRNIHPDLITFYLRLENVPSSRQFDSLPERYTLRDVELNSVLSDNYSSGEVTEMVSELVSLKLLLNDPKSYSTFDEDDSWASSWGMNESKWNMLRLLRKANSLLVENKD
jgi:hypothetical protein